MKIGKFLFLAQILLGLSACLQACQADMNEGPRSHQALQSQSEESLSSSGALNGAATDQGA